MIRVIFLVMCFTLASQIARADEATNCSAQNSQASHYYRNISYAEFGEAVDIKDILRGVLLEHSKEIERIASWNKEYSGPDHDYIPVLVGLLNENAGLHSEFSCFWPIYKEGDVVRKFRDHEPMVSREGLGIFRGGKLVAYFYSAIGVA